MSCLALAPTVVVTDPEALHQVFNVRMSQRAYARQVTNHPHNEGATET